MTFHPPPPPKERSVVLAIDVGSSSIRCSAYDITAKTPSSSGTTTTTIRSSCSSSSSAGCHPPPLPNHGRVVASFRQSRRSVDPGTGRILVTGGGGDHHPTIDGSPTAKSTTSTTTTGNGSDTVGSRTTTSGPGGLLDAIDTGVDRVLQQLERLSQPPPSPATPPHDHYDSYKVRAVGFSTLVMNLVGVDREGALVGDSATLSYACPSPSVHAEVEDLQR